MIHDTLNNAHIYFPINANFKKAFEIASEYYSKNDGRYIIDDNIIIIVSSDDYRDCSEAKLEAHDKYIDIQIVLDGKEGFGYKNRKSCKKPLAEMDTEKDIIFYDDDFSSITTVTNGEFVILFPEDCHAPLIGKGNGKKIIIKCIFQNRDENI